MRWGGGEFDEADVDHIFFVGGLSPEALLVGRVKEGHAIAAADSRVEGVHPASHVAG
jgi:hypothetical protein